MFHLRRRLLFPACTFLVYGLIAASPARGDFPELFNTEPVSDENLVSAEQAAATFDVPDGFRVTAFASEPDVQNPIAMSWDSRGRLWVAENYTYAERSQRFQLDLRDRIVILDGADTDQMTKRTVFTDKLQMLTGLEVGHDGVWVMCPPKLMFLPDRDHDDVPDNDGEVVLDGFEVAQANYHNFANGLRFGPDGWLYGRCGGSCPGRIGKPGTPDDQRLALEGGIWRYHPATGQTEVLTTGTTNPWGHDWNRDGEMFFVNTVNGHLWHMIPGAHFTRPFTLDPNTRTYDLIDFHADHWHFDTTGAWNESRDGVANQYGGGHAHSGAMIYQGGAWPGEYNDRLMTLNFHGRRVNQEILEPTGSGYVARHGKDFLIAADAWFRGMELSSGPDGNVFVLDWSDAGECHEHTGVHRTSGRVYKVSVDNENETASSPRNVREWSLAELVAAHDQPNDWFVRQARLELARRATSGIDVEQAKTMLRDTSTVGRLLTLHTIGGLSDDDLKAATKHPEVAIRVWAIRLLTESWPIDDAMGTSYVDAKRAESIANEANSLMPLLCELATSDPSARVRLTLASTLQRLPVAMRPELASCLVAHGEDAGDHNLPLMIWYGLIPVADQSPDALVSVAASCRLPTTGRLIARCLAEQMNERPVPINDLLSIAATRKDADFTATVLAGVSEGIKGWRSAPQPTSWSALAKQQPDNPLVRELSVVFGDGRAIDELRDMVLGKIEADSEMKLSALATLIQSDADDLKLICQAVLRDPKMNVLAAQGLSKFDDPDIGRALVSRYGNFRAPQRPKIMSILVSRASFAGEMLDALEKGKIPRADLSAFQVRQIHTFGDAELSQRVAEVWGEVRETPEAKLNTIESLKQSLTADRLATADKSNGRALFKRACQNCHQLFGEGAKVGPDLTGANRGNMDYLLSNIVDPSGVVDKDYRMSILLLDDGRIINGLITSETDRTMTVQSATELVTIEKELVTARKITEKSPMPDGLLETLTADEVRDLIGYLGHPVQVALP